MSYVMRATELIGRPVVTLDGAVDVAEVKDVIFDPDQSDLAGFALRGRGAFSTPDAGLLAIGNVRAIGRDAIMVASADAVTETDAGLDAVRDERRDVLGDEVMTESGNRIGRVVDMIVRVEGPSADVAGYEVETADGRRSLVPIPSTLSVSGETLIVPDSVEHFMTDDLTGFGAAVDQFRLGEGDR